MHSLYNIIKSYRVKEAFMGIIVFIGFCFIALIVVCVIIGASDSSGNTKNQHLRQTDQNPYFADGMDKADMELLIEDRDIHAEIGDEVETEFYEDDDFIDKFGDDVL